MSTKRKPKSYPSSYKKNALNLILKKQKPVADVSDELGVSIQTLYKWKREHLEAAEAECTQDPKETLLEVKRLKDENDQLRMEVEILKKATVFFASQK